MRGTLRSEMFTSGIALRGHQHLTVTSQPFGVSWTFLSWEDVVDPAHYCLKSLSAWSTALTTGLGFSSLIPDTISHRFSRTELQLVLEVSYKCIWGDNQGRSVMGQVLAILSTQLVPAAGGGDKNHAAPSIPGPPASKPSLLHGNLLLCFTAD